MARSRTLRRVAPFVALALVAMVLVGCDDPQTTLNPKSDNAEAIQSLYTLVFWLAAAVFVGVLGLTLAFSLMFRERPGREAKQIHGNPRLEVVWTLIPVLIVVVMAVPTFSTIVTLTDDPPDDALQIRAIGHQWWFEFEYPELGIVTASELHIPVDRAVNITLESEDVIHSFWVPQLMGKEDMVPGRTNRIWFTPNEARDEPYLGQCAEFCGLSHANMKFRVFVETQEDFDAWVARQQAERREPTEDLAVQGEQTFTTLACIGCHTVRGTVAAGVAGPDLTHVGERTTIAGGMLAMTPENLAAWLRNPPGIKPGSRMPDLNLTEEQITALVAYLQSLNLELDE